MVYLGHNKPLVNPFQVAVSGFAPDYAFDLLITIDCIVTIFNVLRYFLLEQKFLKSQDFAFFGLIVKYLAYRK